MKQRALPSWPRFDSATGERGRVSAEDTREARAPRVDPERRSGFGTGPHQQRRSCSPADLCGFIYMHVALKRTCFKYIICRKIQIWDQTM